jgi:hypothetical protein
MLKSPSNDKLPRSGEYRILSGIRLGDTMQKPRSNWNQLLESTIHARMSEKSAALLSATICTVMVTLRKYLQVRMEILIFWRL